LSAQIELKRGLASWPCGAVGEDTADGKFAKAVLVVYHVLILMVLWSYFACVLTEPGKGIIENKHSTDVEYTPPTPRGIIENKHSTDGECTPPSSRGIIENKHSTDAEIPPPPRV
jgi:hypothetical protein